MFSVVNCSVLSVGHLVKTSPDSCVTSQLKFNTTCSFSCPHGYQLQGPSYKQCGANGQWTDSAKLVSCHGELKLTAATEKTSSFSLFCKLYYSLRITAFNASDGFFLDVNECTASNGGCSHKCTNTAGGYKCECPDPELSLASDNKTCHGKCRFKNHRNTIKTNCYSFKIFPCF